MEAVDLMLRRCAETDFPQSVGEERDFRHLQNGKVSREPMHR
jgi:hypothetical protein